MLTRSYQSLSTYFCIIFSCLSLQSYSQIQFLVQDPAPFPPYEFGSVEIEDVDNNGLEDVILAGFDENDQSGFQLFLNQGSGSFVENATTVLEVGVSALEVVDIDGDGDKDIFIAGQSGITDQTQLFINNLIPSGTLSFTNSTESFMPVIDGSISTGDYDNNGTLDVFISGEDFSGAYIGQLYSNNPVGTFTPVATSIVGLHESSSIFLDINNDGWDDIIVGGAYSSFVGETYVYLNDQNGGFILNQVLDDIKDGGLDAGDVNGDGLPDLIMAGGFNGGGYLYENDPLQPGTFILSPLTLPFYASSDAKFDDFNSDGALDFVCTGVNLANFGQITSVFMNDGSGSFTEISGSPYVGYVTPAIGTGNIMGNSNPEILITGNTSAFSGGQPASLLLENIGLVECQDDDGDGVCNQDDPCPNNAGAILDDCGICVGGDTGLSPCEAELVLTPSNIAVTPCDEFSVSVSVITNADINVVELFLSFDNNLLEVTDVSEASGNPLEMDVLPPSFDNTEGTISYIASTVNPSSSNFDFLEISFQPLASAGTTSIDPILSGDPNSSIIVTQNIGGVQTPVDILSNSNSTIVEFEPDLTPPEAICQDITVQLDATGSTSILANDINNGSNDLCSSITLSLDQESFTCSDLGDNIVTLTVTDEAGNQASCTSTVSVEDNTIPLITCPSQETIFVDGNCEAILNDYTGDAAINDNCNTTLVQTPTPGTIIGLGETEITLTATDDAGNSANCSFIVNVQDIISPSIICPDNQVVNVSSGCSAILDDYTSMVSADDNCSVIVSQTPSPGSSLALGVSSVTIMATDPSGNSSSCSFDVVVEDNTPPTITCPANETVFANLTCEATLEDYTALASADDNCSVSVSQAPEPGSSIPLGNTNVTLTATDGAGNYTTCTFSVNVEDNSNPTISCPENETLDVDGSCAAVLPNYTGLVSAEDNCSFTITQSPAPGTALNLGANAITLSATDGAGNESSCIFEVNVEDDTPPIISCPANTVVYLDENCSAMLNDYTGLASTSDNCDFELSQLPIAGSSLGLGTTIVTLIATDNAGNSSNCQFEVVVEDNTAPELLCPDDQVVSVNSACEAIIDDYTNIAQADDNCTVSISQSPSPGTVIGLGTTTVDLVATDLSGNTTSCSFQITTIDDTSPTISCPGSDIVVVDATCSSTLADYTSMAIFDDNCDVSVSQTPLPGSILQPGMTNISLIATDNSGNSADCSFIVRVEDNTDPNITCPGDDTIYVGSDCSATLGDYSAMAIVDENCNATVTQSPEAGTVLTPGPTLVTLTATDEAGNTGSCSFTITVQDNISPNITCPSNDLIFVDAACETSLPDYTSLASVDDNCSATLNQAPSPGTVISTGITEVTLTATDVQGNSSQCTFQVNVQDNAAPNVSCPGDDSVLAGANCTAALPDYISLASASDNCSVTISQSPAAGSIINIGNNSVTITATDLYGNSSTCTFNVVVEDQSPPTITCPDDEIIYVNSACEAQLNDYTSLAIANDNCSVTVNQSPAAGSALNLGTTTVTLTATDNSGNSAFCSFEVNVEDDAAPIIECPGDAVQFVGEFCTTSLNDYTSLASAEDNCSYVISQLPAPGTTIGIGVTQVTLTSTDSFGNSTTCSFNVSIEDNLSPAITCPGTQLISIDESCSAVLDDYASSAIANDNCTVTVTQNPVPGSVIEPGSTSVTLVASDPSGNISTCSFNVIVEDNSEPTITCLSDETVFVDGSCTHSLGDYTSLITADDNCTVNISQSPPPGSILGPGQSSITLSATDGAGNTATCVFNLTVEDNSAPTILCASNGTRSVNQTNGSYMVAGSEFDATATDNCGNVVISHNAESISGAISSGDNSTLDGWSLPVGVHTVTFLADDGNGNTSSCQVEITIQGIVISGNVTINLACAPFNLRIQIYEPGSASLVAEQITTINASGDYSAEFTGVSASNYDVYLKVEGYLQQSYPNQDLTGGGTIINLSNLLNGDIVGGSDNFNDNYIGLNDLTYVIGIVFNNIFGGNQYEERADLNCDGVIDALDLSLILFNFNSSGDSPQ